MTYGLIAVAGAAAGAGVPDDMIGEAAVVQLCSASSASLWCVVSGVAVAVAVAAAGCWCYYGTTTMRTTTTYYH